MTTRHPRPLIGILFAVLSAMPVLTFAQDTTSRFGTEWPELQECLAYGEETGAWGWNRAVTSVETEDHKQRITLGNVKVFFLDGGRCALGWTESETVLNRYWRRKEKTPEYTVRLVGTWTLEYRPATVPERALLGIEKRVKFNTYFLDMTFEGNAIPAARADYPGLKEARVNGRLLLALSEFQPYRRDKRAQPVYTTPDRLIWMVVQSDMSPWIFPATVVKNRLLIMQHR